MDFILGLDLGQVNDPSALVIVECQWPASSEGLATYQVRHIERMLGWPYPQVVDQVRRRIVQLPRPCQWWLTADATGVGRPVIDMFTQAKLDPVSITIHGGEQVQQDGRAYRVPKRDLVSALQVCLQTGRLKIASQLPLAAMLVDEMLAFRVRIDIGTGHDSYSAWREKDHDDIVLATAMAVWLGEWLAKERIGPLDLSRGLMGMQIPRQHGSTPDHPARPWLGQTRLFAEDIEDEPEPANWDNAKRLMSEGKLDRTRPIRPERP
jgi:hypothetical protein